MWLKQFIVLCLLLNIHVDGAGKGRKYNKNNPQLSKSSNGQSTGPRKREPKSGQPETPKRDKSCLLFTSSDLGKNYPPIYYYENTKKFVEPKLIFLESGKVSAFDISQGETIDLFCDGGFKGFREDTLAATCTTNNMFLVNGKKVQMKKLECKSRQLAISELTAKSCCKTGKFVDVFFPVGSSKMTVYKSCHNPKTGQNYWTHHLMGPANSAYQADVERELPFTQDKLYDGIKVDNAYRRSSQIRTFASILPGGATDAKYLIHETDNVYLARGHLMAKTDAILDNHQMATFKFVNVMPQFQSFNEGNWLAVEKNLRGFLSLIHKNLNVYTGTHGVLSYKGKHLFLHMSQNDKRIPVPAIFYKIIVTADNKAGVVIVGVNDVHATAANIRPYILCKDVSDQTDVLMIRESQRSNIRAGYIYACPVHEFVNHPDLVNEVPPIRNTARMQILTKAHGRMIERRRK